MLKLGQRLSCQEEPRALLFGTENANNEEDTATNDILKENCMKASPGLQDRSIKRQVRKNSSADLRIRFLELQRLRELVRVAECGRLTATASDVSRARSPNIIHGAEPGARPH